MLGGIYICTNTCEVDIRCGKGSKGGKDIEKKYLRHPKFAPQFQFRTVGCLSSRMMV